MSLGNMLTIFTCLNHNLQNKIFKDLKKYKMTFNVEILIRFYNPKTHELRTISDRKKYLNMIKFLSIEKAHE